VHNSGIKKYEKKKKKGELVLTIANKVASLFNSIQQTNAGSASLHPNCPPFHSGQLLHLSNVEQSLRQ